MTDEEADEDAADGCGGEATVRVFAMVFADFLRAAGGAGDGFLDAGFGEGSVGRGARNFTNNNLRISSRFGARIINDKCTA